MQIIGLTGGIGSGKSIIAKVFSELFGIPVYNADQRAKYLMQHNTQLKHKLINILGPESYNPDNTLNRKYVADKIFQDNDLLKSVNKLVHHQVGLDFEKWKNKQSLPYVLHEAAILIESGFHKNIDKLITVSAPESIRIERVQKRDNLSKEQILQRVEKQITDLEREKVAHFVIVNDNNQSIIDQVKTTHEKLINNG